MSRTADGPVNTRIVRLPLASLRFAERNARVMSYKTYNRLVENIRQDGRLTSVPFAALVGRDADGSPIYEIISGNHRVRAALDAGITEADVMVTDDPLPRSRLVAMQLAHNAITGYDDPAMLKQLYDELDEIDWKAYAGLDDATLGLLEHVSPASLSPPQLAFTTIQILFLPDEWEQVGAAWEEARPVLAGADAIWLARMAEYRAALDALEEVGLAYNVKNVALQFVLLVDLYRRHLTDLRDGWAPEDAHPGELVPLVSLFGVNAVPTDAARVILAALETMVARGEIPSDRPWQALELWAADYLAGGGQE